MNFRKGAYFIYRGFDLEDDLTPCDGVISKIFHDQNKFEGN